MSNLSLSLHLNHQTFSFHLSSLTYHLSLYQITLLKNSNTSTDFLSLLKWFTTIFKKPNASSRNLCLIHHRRPPPSLVLEAKNAAAGGQKRRCRKVGLWWWWCSTARRMVLNDFSGQKRRCRKLKVGLRWWWCSTARQWCQPFFSEDYSFIDRPCVGFVEGIALVCRGRSF
ncbi:uncharacterized protein LOC118479492 [Helianthus annuus]|uniref:uncharacterized protein LOC118479492 n=1 Tax=Helianthus annuus TaxID=4232 RepID=UPI0016532A68|nr:uncharacterized protein LOC118479492 [Helianthus annuus]